MRLYKEAFYAPQKTAPTHEIILGEEELSDVSGTRIDNRRIRATKRPSA
jgi:hypothetical protein